ncbi:MAG: 3-deoxy-D-manno-octulosonic acid transferase [Candidatus Nitrospinota bacterium M3_3B_026]
MTGALYGLASRAGYALASPYIAWRLLTRPEYRENFRQRLGLGLPRYERRTIWIHAVSVGEAAAAEPVARHIKARAPQVNIVLTVTTPSGRGVAEKKLSAIADIHYFPYDLPGAARRAARAFNPGLFFMIDTEIWPGVIAAVREHGGAVAIVNGRISDRSYPRYRRMRWFFRDVLSNVDLFLMRTRADADRIIDIGADPGRVEVGGDLKFDGMAEETADRAALRKSLGLGEDEKVVLLGSVHEGEEAAIAAAVEAIERAGAGRLVIAPRRIEDIGWIEHALQGSGLRAVRKTSMPPAPEPDGAAVPVIDTFGELKKLYAAADVVFVGGSLIDHGGQNPLEPAAAGVAPVFGPSMSNFRGAASALLEAGGAFQAASGAKLSERLADLLKDGDKRRRAGEAAREVVERNRGVAAKAAERLIALYRG